MAQRKTGIMVNVDINSVVTPFLNETAKKPNLSEADYYPFVDIYAGTGVTDLLFCTFCQFSLTPSRIFTDAVTKFHQTSENGEPVNYYDWYYGHKVAWEDNNIDPVVVWLRRTREQGMRAWMSLRMNDCHEPDAKACFLRSDFFYEAREKGWMLGREYGYYRNCFDYAVPQVREKMLAYIDEQLTRYSPDMDGLELDFLRESHCFDYLHCPNAVEIMTDFVAQVKGLLRREEQRLGRPIELSVRLGRDMAHDRLFGFDAAALVGAGVDRIIVSPRWETTDSDMPIDAWRNALPNTAITAGLEVLLNRQRDESYTSADAARGYAAHYLGMGSDGIYLFNYFVNPYDRSERTTRNHEIHAACGDLGTIAQGIQMQVLTYEDNVPRGAAGFRPLPRTLAEPFTHTFTSALTPTEFCQIIVGTESEEDMAALHVALDAVPLENGAKVGGAEYGEEYAFDNTVLYAFAVPADLWRQRKTFPLTVSAEKNVKLTYLAIYSK